MEMWKKRWQFLYLALFTSGVLDCTSTQAQELNNNHNEKFLSQIDSYIHLNDSIAQVNRVSQLRDVSPTDWAYEALRTLVERYGCIVGYPDSTFRGSRALSRYEFAAGLNACMQQMERLIAQSEAVLLEDIEKLQRLMKEFETELVALGARVDNLEGRVAFLEDHQFSTTTKLQGESSISITSAFGSEKAGGGKLDEIPVMQQRTRLILNTSFTGKDLLKMFLNSGNATPFDSRITGTNMTQLNFPLDTNSSVVLGKMFYRFSPSDNLKVHIDAVGGGYNASIPTFNELFSPEITGALSSFGRFNPIYYQGVTGSGGTLTYDFSKVLSLSAGYLARGANNPTSGQGLFNGDYAALAQLAVKPTDNFRFGITYVRSFYPDNEVLVSGGTGSKQANQPFGRGIATSADHLGLQFSYRISPNLNFSGWGGLSFAHANASGFNEDANSFVEKGNKATMYNWAVTLALLDIGSEGSLLGFTVGQPPKVSFNSGGGEDPDSAWHLEAQYRYQINDNIAINPGFFVVLNPENNSNNDAIWVGTIRTIFMF